LYFALRCFSAAFTDNSLKVISPERYNERQSFGHREYGALAPLCMYHVISFSSHEVAQASPSSEIVDELFVAFIVENVNFDPRTR
jgi:hypothetical protein